MPPSRITRPAAQDAFHAWWDTIIVVVVGLNLLLILLDTLYALGPVHALVDLGPASLQSTAAWMHANFTTIDLYFVALLALDVLAGWLVAIRERRYHRWFFYPFIHWYDVLGCIPVSGFRVLRVLRVVSLLIRLQRMGTINVRQWSVYQFCYKYYQILMEELTDRVAIKMLGNVQTELSDNGKLTDRITRDVLLPRKQALIEDMTDRTIRLILQAYGTHRADILGMVRSLVHDTLSENPDMHRLKRLPMGDTLATAMEQSLTEAVCGLLDGSIQRVNQRRFRDLAESMAESGFDAWIEDNASANREIEQVMIEVLDVMKSQIRQQQWKMEYGAESRPPHHQDEASFNPK
ncbi:ion transporter [Larsenimonas rhizosphaerae]|uniref:Ion transporter n=1 Tax=Larsenimonas rhizosphaerae TaxID=2944682 RepID=A0AA41ZJA6_9GAMM|nr:ion transporter [Larsenimonas rhizosphaerae]MCX2524958.1 ion transporter [Larsenimonas rhizosphaerae]